MALTPEGKLSRYFYGVQSEPKDLRLGLIEASKEKIGTPVDAVLLYCFHYDPKEGKYTADVMRFVRIGGGATLFGLVALGFVLFRRERRKLAEAAREAGVDDEAARPPEADRDRP